MAESDPGAEEERQAPVVAVEEREGVVLVVLSGEHDAGTAPDIRAAVTKGTLAGKGVAVSLADVSFIDSAVVHVLVVGDRKLSERGRRLALYVEPGSPVERVLEICRLDETLLFGVTVDEAVEFARQAGPETLANPGTQD